MFGEGGKDKQSICGLQSILPIPCPLTPRCFSCSSADSGSVLFCWLHGWPCICSHICLCQHLPTPPTTPLQVSCLHFQSTLPGPVVACGLRQDGWVTFVEKSLGLYIVYIRPTGKARGSCSCHVRQRAPGKKAHSDS